MTSEHPNIQNFKQIVQNWLDEVPEVQEAVGKDPEYYVDATVRVVKESEGFLNWDQIMEKVCHKIVKEKLCRKCVSREEVPTGGRTMDLAETKKNLENEPDTSSKWILILEEIRILMGYDTIEKGTNEFYGNVFKNLTIFLERREAKRARGRVQDAQVAMEKKENVDEIPKKKKERKRRTTRFEALMEGTEMLNGKTRGERKRNEEKAIK